MAEDTEVVVEVVLTNRTAQMLSTTAMANFIEEQPDRFEFFDPDVVPFGDVFTGGTMFWCATASDTLLLAGYERARGYQAVLIWDLVDGEAADGWVVLSSRPWSDYVETNR